MNLFDVYPLFDINIIKGKGCHVWDENGTEYLVSSKNAEGLRRRPTVSSRLNIRFMLWTACPDAPFNKLSMQEQLQNSFDAEIDFIPYRGDFPRGIFATLVVKTKVALEEIVRMYEEYYAKDSFVHIVDKNIDLKQVVNTNKCLIHLEKHGDKLLIDNPFLLLCLYRKVDIHQISSLFLLRMQRA